MLPQEKVQLLDLLSSEWRWCREAEARDPQGNAVRYDDQAAVAWDVTGAICFLFGWPRACELFQQLDKHIRGRQRLRAWRRHPEIDAMAALQDLNDLDQTTHGHIIAHLQSMPVRRGNRECVE